MGKKRKNIGDCALCKEENIQLRDSHIIPKLVYNRLKSKPNSRFRNYFNLKEIYQDGEKKPMLCDECEKLFNSFETPYANKVLKPYIEKGQKKRKKDECLDKYIFSLNWRILYDDCYVIKSIDMFDNLSKKAFQELEEHISKYLNGLRTQKEYSLPTNKIKNYVFYMSDLGYGIETRKHFFGMTYGYCFSRPKNNKYIVFAYYLDIILVTVYTPDFLLIDFEKGVIQYIMDYFRGKNIKSFIKEEVENQLLEINNQKEINKKYIKEANLSEKLIKRYGNGKRS